MTIPEGIRRLGLAGLFLSCASSGSSTRAPDRNGDTSPPGAPGVESPGARAPGQDSPSTAAEYRMRQVKRIDHPEVTDSIRAIVESPDRSAGDRALDEGRKPGELLAFVGVQPGMRVGEIGAAGGYTTELLARAVSPSGRVYAQNSPFMLQRFAAKPWAERLARPALAAVVRLDREFDAPFSPEVGALDLVVSVLVYHDTVWLKVDRDRMNHAVFASLRPGGKYAIIDHSARPGALLNDVETFHRIEESSVIDEVERAGFRLAATSDFLRNREDPRDWNDSPKSAGDRRGTSDRFALLFVRP